MDVVSFLLFAHTATIALAAFFLLYPVLAYAWNVAYTAELMLLSAAFVCLASGYVASFVFHASLANSILNLVSAVTAFWAVWRLATRFVEPGDEPGAESVTMASESVEEGFRGGR